MLTSKRSTSSFGMLAGISKLALGVAMGLGPSCAVDESASSADPVADGAASAADNEVVTDSVCTTGRFQCHAYVQVKQAGGQRITAHAATPTGYGPAALQAAYKLDPSTIVPAKPVVAIIDAYGYTALESDLAAYRSHYNLPPCTIANGCLKVVNQQGQAAPLPADPPASDDWTVETALDIDMVSAACPKCNILVVQATDNAGDGLFIAQNAAAALGATVISNSWGGPEQANTTPSMTATKSALDDIHPSITAPARPERLTRLKQRRRVSVAASPNATLEVPSGESSSTTIISHGASPRAVAMRSKRIGTFFDS